MARGEFVATALAVPDLISLPPFLWAAAATTRPVMPLVARENELARLDVQLNAALAGEGGIVFISGEAGDGKTMLAQTFVEHSQAQHSELIVATGHCNAYTGIGDPYLPFREILELLTGDIEPRWSAGSMSITMQSACGTLFPKRWRRS